MGESKHDGLAIPGRVVLAHEPPFKLGELKVDPATRQIERGSRRETLEPRVMQVLVALSRADGAIVTRDELIARCWDGRIVTDDAINRVLSRIRQVANHIGGGSFRLETITKVGYRLVETSLGARSDPEFRFGAMPQKGGTNRRNLIAGATALALGITAGGILWQQPWRHRPPPEAEQLYRRGVLISREAMPGTARQMVSYFERAVAIDPDYADAWGALALAYSHLLQGFDEAELASLPVRIRAAAQRALTLDSDNADAQLALIFLTPYYGNWAAKERQLIKVTKDHSRHWLAHGRLAQLYYQVGRLTDGLSSHRKALAIEPMLPVAYASMIRSLSALGRIQEADALIEHAQVRWSSYPGLWLAKFDHLLFSGRPRSAAAFANDPQSLPSGFGPAPIERRIRLARAVETGEPGDAEVSIQDHMEMAGKDVTSIPAAATAFAALGRFDLTLASLERYYFDRGGFKVASSGRPHALKFTDFLFASPMAALRTDARFDKLLEEIGLEAYWRETGALPSYRREQ